MQEAISGQAKRGREWVKSSQESSVLFNPHFSFQLYDDLHMFVELHFVII
jgi:hypothetical protein